MLLGRSASLCLSESRSVPHEFPTGLIWLIGVWFWS